jgi:DinB superfamily
MTPRELATLLQATPTILRSIMTSVPEDVHHYRPRQGEWCIKEIVGHLTEEDRRDFAGRLRPMLQHSAPRVAVTDQAAVAAARGDCAKGIESLLVEFATVRAANLALIRSVSAPQLLRVGIHPVNGPFTVDALLHEWAYHDLEHIRQAFATVQIALWPQLGALKGFYSAGTL